MNLIPLENLTMRGELAMRANLNYARLETAKYWPETIFEMDQHAWPADWEGRTILALVMHAQATGRHPAYLDSILDHLPDRVNNQGYIGPEYPAGVTHEQAMSGHSWMIRALTEYYQWMRSKDAPRAARALEILRSIVRGLYLPQTNNYRQYPTDPSTRHDDPHWILSHKQSKTKTHAGTSDCGCAFIAIDGATAAHELLGDQEPLQPLIEAMIASYAALPREALHVQTHATLSAIRGVLRYYRNNRNPAHLALARDVFDLYKAKAWTDHYANYNWFGLPRWTEPCAVIDSFIISQELWHETGEPGYLADAHHILYNAIAHAERASGAFGTDLCVGAKVKPPSATGGTDSHASDQAIIFAKPLTYEVFWCCNMRGGDGLARAAMYSFYHDGDTVIIPYYHTCRVELPLASGTLVLDETADYPASGTVRLETIHASGGRVCLRLFAPEAWTSGVRSRVTLNGKPLATSFKQDFIVVTCTLATGDIILLETDIRFHTLAGNPCVNNSKDHFSFRHGPMLLGVKSVLSDPADQPVERFIDRTAPCHPIGGARYSTVTRSGEQVTLQPMWGKENLINPNDALQVLFHI
jgi:uncharacterized protein